MVRSEEMGDASANQLPPNNQSRVFRAADNDDPENGPEAVNPENVDLRLNSASNNQVRRFSNLFGENDETSELFNGIDQFMGQAKDRSMDPQRIFDRPNNRSNSFDNGSSNPEKNHSLDEQNMTLKRFESARIILIVISVLGLLYNLYELIRTEIEERFKDDGGKVIPKLQKDGEGKGNSTSTNSTNLLDVSELKSFESHTAYEHALWILRIILFAITLTVGVMTFFERFRYRLMKYICHMNVLNVFGIISFATLSNGGQMSDHYSLTMLLKNSLMESLFMTAALINFFAHFKTWKYISVTMLLMGITIFALIIFGLESSESPLTNNEISLLFIDFFFYVALCGCLFSNTLIASTI